MLPAIEQRFGCRGTGRRGVFGKISGGYGAIARTHCVTPSFGRPQSVIPRNPAFLWRQKPYVLAHPPHAEGHFLLE
jgi:hypothetical protein